MVAVHILKQILVMINDESNVEMAAQRVGEDVEDYDLLALLRMVFLIVLIIDKHHEILIFILLVNSHKGQLEFDVLLWWFLR